MDRQEKFQYWFEQAEYDFVTAEAMLKTGRYVYVAFMCQQSLKKIIKGLYTFYLEDNVPRVHNLTYIFNKLLAVKPVEVTAETYALFDTLSAYYISGRYPTYKEKVAQNITGAIATDLLQRSREVFTWMSSLKK